MSKLGQRLIKALEEFSRDVKSGKPMEQHTIRCMKMKGKTVYVHDKFTAPIGRKGRL